MQAQTWLGRNYPQGGWINYYGEKEQRSWIGEIYINEQLEGECANCFQYKKVDSESGLCKKCSADYGN